MLLVRPLRKTFIRYSSSSCYNEAIQRLRGVIYKEYEKVEQEKKSNFKRAKNSLLISKEQCAPCKIYALELEHERKKRIRERMRKQQLDVIDRGLIIVLGEKERAELPSEKKFECIRKKPS